MNLFAIETLVKIVAMDTKSWVVTPKDVERGIAERTGKKLSKNEIALIKVALDNLKQKGELLQVDEKSDSYALVTSPLARAVTITVSEDICLAAFLSLLVQSTMDGSEDADVSNGLHGIKYLTSNDLVIKHALLKYLGWFAAASGSPELDNPAAKSGGALPDGSSGGVTKKDISDVLSDGLSEDGQEDGTIDFGEDDEQVD